MYSLDDITVLIVNYRTPDLIRRCVESLRTYYPEIKMLLIDNGSFDASREYIKRMDEQHEQVTGILNVDNRFHGPALDQGLRACFTPLALTLDSDTETIRGGFLEQMSVYFYAPEIYAVGQLITMDWFGYETHSRTPLAFQYVHPSCMLVRRAVYLRLKPFIHHGSPAIHNMRHARRAGYHLMDYPVGEYLQHTGRGTCYALWLWPGAKTYHRIPDAQYAEQVLSPKEAPLERVSPKDCTRYLGLHIQLPCENRLRPISG